MGIKKSCEQGQADLNPGHFQPGVRWREMVRLFEEECGGNERFLKSAKECAARKGWIYFEGTYWVYRTHRKAKHQVERWLECTRDWRRARSMLNLRAGQVAFQDDWKKQVLHLRLMMAHLEDLDPKTFKEKGWEPNEVDLLALMAEQEACGE